MASVCSDQEKIEELKHRLLCVAVELESARISAEEDKRRNEENVKSVIQLLKEARKERDEARDLLEQLSNKLVPSSQIDLKTMATTNENFIITECENSLYETYNHQLYGSSPVDSFFDAVPSPDLSSMMNIDGSNNMLLHQPLIQECTGQSPHRTSNIAAETSEAIETLIRGKTLPQKGRLLDAVIEAGPLLQTLLLMGTLPQWHNPPPS